ncbi:MAG: TIR domain-containing protein, partial [Chloroflexi bacterium]|nr:TIR domain-containing protein [Chloroflexota bacterium]
MRPLRVFLCHASQDKPAVRKMYAYLKQHNIQPWLDRENLLPGQDWQIEIPKALFSSDVILVCLSKNSVNKEGYVQKEIVFALDKALEKPEGTIFIIPVKFEECDVPKRLSRYQWVDYYKTDGRKRLLMGLSLRAQGLGEEIAPVAMDDSKQRSPQTKPSKPEIKKETKSESQGQPVPSAPQIERKFTQKKPYTRILNPSALNPFKNVPVQKNQPGPNYRLFGLVGIIVLIFIFGGLGLNSLFNKPPEATSTPTSHVFTETSKPPTKTIIPFTPTTTETPAPSPTATTVLGIGSTSRSLKDDMVLVYIPAGEFTMGSLEWSQVAHRIYLDAYWIDQTEVTNAMYIKCVEANQCDPPGKKRSQTRPLYFDEPE